MKKDIPKRYIFNKVFSGSYLLYNLGNELINFMIVDSCNKNYDKRRLIYINPYGNYNEVEANNAEYVLHVMNVKYEGLTFYELIAISEIDKTKGLNLYDKSAEQTRKNIEDSKIEFNSCALEEIFKDENSHLCSFVAKNFYTPKDDTHILFYVKSDNKKKRKIPKDSEKIKIIKIKSNPQHSFCYSKTNDQTILDDIRNNYFEENNESNITLPKYTEQSLSIICDRTKLEDSTSNQIAYFLSRDTKMMEKFIEYLNDNRKKDEKEIIINKNTKIEIIREHEHIDLLIKIINSTENNKDYSNDHIIVIENKIDSGINGVEKNYTSKSKSQLSDYYEYITTGVKKTSKGKEKENKELQSIDSKNKHFFILVPSYSTITEEILKKEYKNGKEYSILHYDKLSSKLPKSYNPYKTTDINILNERKFLYEEFIKTLKYINMTNSTLMRELSYIRLKQRIDEIRK